MVIYKSTITEINQQYFGDDRVHLKFAFFLEGEKQTPVMTTVYTPRLLKYLKIPEDPIQIHNIRRILVGKEIGIDIK